jgi:hypothetical protein
MANKKQTGKSADAAPKTEKAPESVVTWTELDKEEVGKQGNLTICAALIQKVTDGVPGELFVSFTKEGSKKGGDTYRAQLFSVPVDLVPNLQDRVDQVLLKQTRAASEAKKETAEPAKATKKAPAKPKVATPATTNG